MKRTTLLLAGLLTLAAAYTDDYQEVARQAEQDIDATTLTDAPRTTATQATAIANLFCPHRGGDGGTNKTTASPAELTSVSHYVEGGDTLLFAFNYGDQEGYMMVGRRRKTSGRNTQTSST